MKKLLSLLLAVLMVLGISGCAQTGEETPGNPDEPQKQKFTKSFIDYFDTASTIVGYDYSQEEFDEKIAVIEEQLLHFHQLYDIYNHYDGVTNIYDLNKEAGSAPVEVDEDIILLFEFCREMYDLTEGKTNYAMGSVLKIWHNYREEGNSDYLNAKVPPMEELSEAAKHCNIDNVIIDKENSTVFFADPMLKVDVGAIGKGYATERIAKILEEMGVDNYTLNIGGNIRTIGTKGDGTGWIAGIQNPDLTSEQTFILRVNFSDLALVTSGSYQRYYYVGETKYHHIIDPETLFPKDDFAAVSILTPDSGLADAVSTACFNLTLEEGMALIESIENTEAMWVEPDGTVHFSSGFEAFIQPEK
ncbi:MAG: FAD:protein FMN transferase [Ruminococcaceae bacterium]|nr:FAD:protein FMN transferase [Oscillospiraceae bacterium]